MHFGERKWERAAELPAAEASEQLRQMLTGHGFTRVFDTGSPLRNTLALRRRIAAGEVAGPAILTTGGIIWPKGGVPSLPVMAALGFIIEPQDEVATPDEVLFGTDVGYMLDYDPAEEFALMARAGLSFTDILASLTTNPALRRIVILSEAKEA